ncbi:MAG: type II secretion system protein GspD, partial [Verrucomicrobia bacterium]|nr:type II secretion system protein GspD [Verrucomicrobiota bacterium]
DAGVPFPTGTSLTYFERARTVYVRNTPENLEIFERILATFNVVPTQVEIESKFIEITQTDLDELGFQWNLGPMSLNQNPQANSINSVEGGGLNLGALTGQNIATNLTGWMTGGLRGASLFKANVVESLLVGGGGSGSAVNDAIGTFAGVLNNAQVSMVVNALSQKKSADVLSAPKVTTISGAQAQIRVVQEFIYPSEYSQPTVSDNSVPTPSIPTAFKTREVGVILSVTPTVGADGYTINLTLVPEVSAFVGMLDYSPDPLKGSMGGGTLSPQSPIEVAYKIWQPLFETRNVTTSVVIWDGQTVVLGGLIREEVSKIDDKIPVLGDIPLFGRLFRTKAFSRIKRNLLVFVTARLIDPSGNLIHRPDSAGFRFDPAGNPIRPSQPQQLKRP